MTINRFANKEFCNDKNLVTTIRLARTRNVGPITFLKLLSKYKTPDNALNEVQNILKGKNITGELYSQTQAEEEISRTQKFGGNIISIFDEAYPYLLSEIYDPPIMISYRGNLGITKNRSVAIVGARNSSNNGVSLTYKFSSELTQAGYTITSGLAKGIDAAAHKAAIDAKNKASTIAVIAGGIDNIYPKENKKLYEEIFEKGLVISENPFGSLPKSESFPRRNRIISGLSLGVLVIEAAIRSGSLITARFASEQGREVFCIPGFPLDPRAEGPNDLIKKGAMLVTDSTDIISSLRDFTEEKIIDRKQSNLLFDSEDNIDFDIANYESKIPDKEIIEIEETKIFSADNIIKNLSYTPTEIDEIVRQTKLSSSQLNSILLELEIAGEIMRHPGNRISLAG